MSEQEPNDMTPKVTDKAQLEFMAGFEAIRKKPTTIQQKNRELAELIATSHYLNKIFTVVWRLGSNTFELFDELRSLTFLKRLKSMTFPPVQKSRICDYMFIAIRFNWITVSKYHRHRYRTPSISTMPTIAELAVSSAVRLEETDQTFRVPFGPGAFRKISKTMLHDAVAALTMVDREAGACLKLRLDGVNEKEISTKLGFSRNETRRHIRRAQQVLRIILVRKLAEQVDRPFG